MIKHAVSEALQVVSEAVENTDVQLGFENGQIKVEVVPTNKVGGKPFLLTKCPGRPGGHLRG